MTSQPLELEGTWEEILTQAPEIANCRLRVTVLSKEPQPNSAKQPANFRPASGRSLLRHARTWAGDDLSQSPPPSTAQSLLKYAGTWEGDDLQECLRLVYETRSQLEL
jgi:hypothetical protein